ncbi:MAG: hypothetical protein HYS73_00955 [Parcubacteria group bacterium]|nr:hypothetical protein [Parcubacteria group bacterium]MBI2049026.1 hypothetical protein [Parcubacteria group bacterium]
MHSSFLHTTRIILAAAALALFVAALSSLGGFSADPARAAAGDDVNGYAWSDNIGWISFDDGNVNVDETTGAFSGYAWSDNIGWINFAPDASGALESPKTGVFVGLAAAGDSKPVTGWARACSVFQVGCSGLLKNSPDGSDVYRGGWDGWIKMSGGWADGVTLDTTTNTFSGYAWGDVIFGWIDMSGVTYGGAPAVAEATPSVTLTAPANVEKETPFNIEARLLNLVGKTCTDGGSPEWWDDSLEIQDNDERISRPISDGITEATTYTLSCDSTDGAPVTVNVNPFIVSFTADGYSATSIVGTSDEATLAWSTANTDGGTDSCTISNITIPSPGLSGSAVVSPDVTTDYTLSCEREGVPFGSGSRTVRVNFIPSGFILEPEPQNISITTIGRGSVGTGGVSDKALFHVRADNSFTANVDLSISANPFPSEGVNIYKFQIVKLCDVAGKYVVCAEDPLVGSVQNGGISVSSANFWNDSRGIEFWVDSPNPLTARTVNEIVIHGEEVGAETPATDDMRIILDSRLFDPEYKEF